MKNHHRTHTVKLISVGNSKGVRLPKRILQKYGFSDRLLLEETEHGLLLRQIADAKLSWEATYKEMAIENEDWQDFENTILDGIEIDETTAL